MDMSDSSEMTSAEILERATALLNHPTEETAGLWPRATAVLARQALEVGLHEALSAKILGIQSAPVRVQLLCLQSYLEDTETAHEVNLAWWGLSQACHHLSYELPPTAPELEGLIDVVRRFVRAV
jgi:hypothetical protein